MSEQAPERAQVDIWLNLLDDALAALPDLKRVDIVSETRSHVEDRLQAGLSAEQALHGFGPARTYAQAFIDDHALTHALTHKRIFLMIKTLSSFAGRSVVALLGLFGALLFGGIALGALISIPMKLFNPDKVGVWSSPDHLLIGASNLLPNSHEIAGNWGYLIFLAMLVTGVVLARYSLIAALRSIKGKQTQLAA